MADDPTLNALLQRHGPAALLYARQITGSLADAEDALQEGFIRFWKHHKTARESAALLFAAVRTAALDLQRGERRRKRREQTVAADHALLNPRTALDPERRRTIEEALAALPQPQREVVVLKIWAGLTFAEIAESLDESPNTIAARYRYAIEKLAAPLATEVQHDA